MASIRRTAAMALAMAASFTQEAIAQAPRQGFVPAAINVYLGAMEVDDQSLRIEDSDVLGDADLDFSTLPGGGIFVEMPFGVGAGIEAGVEAGGGIAWRNDDTNVYGSSINGNTRVVVDVDNSFVLADLEMGLYARAHIGPVVSLYVGGGPALVYGEHDVGDERVDPMPDGTVVVLREDEASDLNAGYYARAGIDFQLQGGYRMGLGAKWLGAELDFDDTIGAADIEGVFLFLNIGHTLP